MPGPRLKPITASIMLAVSSGALAQTPEVIVITANAQQQRWLDAAASIEVRALPRSGLLIDSGQLLQGIPGLQVDSRANFAQDTRLSIRGFGSRSAFGVRGIYLSQDGIPISAPDGQGQLSSVLLDNIAEIEVLRGPLAVLYGNGAGGVIALRTTTEATARAGTALAVSQQHQQYQLAGRQQFGQHQFSLAAKHFESDGFRPHSAARKQQLQGLWQTQLADSLSASLRLDFAYDPLLQDPLSLTPTQWRADPKQTVSQAQQFDTTKSTRQRQLSLALQQSGHSPWQLALWRGEREVTQRLAFTGAAITSAGGDIALDRQYQGVNGQYSWHLTDVLQSTIGGAWVSSDDERQGFVNNFGQRGDLRRDETNLAENRDLFWRLHWQATAQLSVDAGLRYTELSYQIRDRFIQGANPDDSGRKNYYQQAAAMGLNYRLNDAWSWFISTGLGFEAPTLAELAYKPEGSGLNLALLASENRQWESGVKYAAGRARFSVSAFSIRSSDELLVASSDNGRTSFRNAGATARQGLEFYWQQQLTPALSQQVALTYLDAQFDSAELAGKRIPGVARLDSHWQLSCQPWLTRPLFLEWTSRYRDQIAINDQNSDFAPASLSFDLSLLSTQQLGQWQVRSWLQLQNLTNRNNVGAVVVNQSNGRAFESAPGRQLSAGINLDYLW
ncbi:MAG: TonB-dependent receptor family protein [Alishewanella aestuarii]